MTERKWWGFRAHQIKNQNNMLEYVILFECGRDTVQTSTIESSTCWVMELVQGQGISSWVELVFPLLIDHMVWSKEINSGHFALWSPRWRPILCILCNFLRILHDFLHILQNFLIFSVFCICPSGVPFSKCIRCLKMYGLWECMERGRSDLDRARDAFDALYVVSILKLKYWIMRNWDPIHCYNPPVSLIRSYMHSWRHIAVKKLRAA